MLQAIRERTAGWVAGFVVALLAIPFALWGINNYFVPQVETWVAKVDGEEISQAEFQRQLGNYRQRMRTLMEDSFDAQMFEDPGFRREFLEDMIRQRVLLQAIENSGYQVLPGLVANEIAGFEAFQSNGEFSSSRYQQALRRIGMSPGQFEQQVRTSLLTEALPDALRQTQVITDQELNALIRLMNQTRSFDYFLYPAERFHDRVSVSEEEIAAYYEENQDEFTSPERVTVSYLELDAANVAQEISVDEAMLRSWFEENRHNYLTREQRLASHILIQVPGDAGEEAEREARQRAAQVAERVREGEDFAELARELSDDPGSANAGGELGWIERDQLPSGFEDALFALEQGEISDPVRTGSGYHVIRLEDVQEPRGQTFEQAREAVARDFRSVEAERRFLELTDRLVDLTYENPSTLEPAAEDLDLEIHTVGPFTREGGEGIAADPEFVDTAFSDLVLTDRINSDPVDLGPNHVAVLRVSEHEPAAPRPLSTVRDSIRDRLRDEKAETLARERANASLEHIRAGELDPDAAAEEAGTDLISAESVGRGAADHPAPLLDEVFRLPAPGESTTFHALPAGDGDYAVVALRDITPGDPFAISQVEREQLRQQLAQTHLQAELNSLVRSLESRADVRIAEDRL